MSYVCVCVSWERADFNICHSREGSGPREGMSDSTLPNDVDGGYDWIALWKLERQSITDGVGEGKDRCERDRRDVLAAMRVERRLLFKEWLIEKVSMGGPWNEEDMARYEYRKEKMERSEFYSGPSLHWDPKWEAEWATIDEKVRCSRQIIEDAKWQELGQECNQRYTIWKEGFVASRR